MLQNEEGERPAKASPLKSHLDSAKVGENAIGDFISHFMPVVKVLFWRNPRGCYRCSPPIDATPREPIPWTCKNGDGARVNRLRTCPWLVATLRRYPGNPYET